MTKACKATRKNGQPCQAPAGQDGYCFGHSPRLSEARRAGSSRGGRHKRTEARATRLMPEVLRPVLYKLLHGMAEVDAGRMDPRVATALASLASATVKVYRGRPVSVHQGRAGRQGGSADLPAWPAMVRGDPPRARGASCPCLTPSQLTWLR